MAYTPGKRAALNLQAALVRVKDRSKGREKTKLPAVFERFEKSPYTKRMERLSNRIFGENWYPVRDAKDEKVVRQFSSLPLEQDERYNTRYYPPHPMFHYLTKMLRLHGLYRNEHQDFREEIERLRALRGKAQPKPGEGKRAMMRKGGGGG